MSYLCLTKDLNYGNSSVNDFVKRVSNITPTEIFELQRFYHKHCYADFGNVEKRNRALLRYEEAIAKKSSEVTSRQPGRPRMDNSKNEQPSSKRTLRSESTPYNRELCIICQQPGGVCRTVAFLQTGQSMLNVDQKLADKSFYRRLNTIPNADDAVANEVKYHLKCWSSCKQIAAKKESESIDNEKESYAQTVSDIEIVNLIQSGLNDPSLKILDMNMINDAYRDILLENGLKNYDIKSNYKRYLKELLLKNVANIKFVKNKNPSKPEIVCSEIAQGQAIDIAVNQNRREVLSDILNVSKVIRNELQSHQKWKFTGTYSDFIEPNLLSTLIKWILIGPNENLYNENRIKRVENATSVVTQLIVQSFKTKRQVHYEPVDSSTRGIFQMNETPLSVGLGLYVHHTTRSKELIELLHTMNLSVTYDKVLDIRNSIATTIKSNVENHPAKLHIPSVISPNKHTFYAIDNSDLKVDTTDGKNQYHGTSIAIYQPHDTDFNPPLLKFDRKHVEKFDGSHTFYETIFCPEPVRESKTYGNLTLPLANTAMDLEHYILCDVTYLVLKCFNTISHGDIPTWTAYNSLISDKNNSLHIVLYHLYMEPQPTSPTFTQL